MPRFKVSKVFSTSMVLCWMVCASLLLGSVYANDAVEITTEVLPLNDWPGGKVQLHINRPQQLMPNLPVVIVIPGAKRNAEDYSQYWLPFVKRLPMITVTIECDLTQCPTEYDYNLGGYKRADGTLAAVEKQLFQVPELAFQQLKQHFQLTSAGFYLFGHSAGGTFAHLYPLLKPDAPIIGVVAANPAFMMVPDAHKAYPFGLKHAGFTDKQISDWLAKSSMALMLGDRDLAPRTKALSNSLLAQQQGLSVFSRGLNFFSRAIDWGQTAEQQTGWKIVIVPGVGHNAGEMAPYAFEHWFSAVEAAQ